MDRRAALSSGQRRTSGSSRPDTPRKCRVWINSKFQQQRITDPTFSRPTINADEAAELQEPTATEQPHPEKTPATVSSFDTKPWTEQYKDRMRSQVFSSNSSSAAKAVALVQLDDVPGPSGIQQRQSQPEPPQKPRTLVKQPKKGMTAPEQKQSEAAKRRPSDDKESEAVKSAEAAQGKPHESMKELPENEPVGASFNDLPLHITTRISQMYLDSLPTDNTQLDVEFATLMQAMAYNKHAVKLLGNIHTAAIVRDYLILLRGDNVEDAYIFQWRKRSSWIALKMMATLRENGAWSCKSLKIYDTSPMHNPARSEAKTKAIKAVMHNYLSKLLVRFGATEEVKLAECPFFWGIKGINSLRGLTTSLHSTPAIRGIPDSTWMPGGHWSGIHRQPRLLRRSDALSFVSTEISAYKVQRMQSRTTHWSSYTAEAQPPSTNFINPRRKATTPTEAATSTFQISAWKLKGFSERLYQDSIPQGFERIDVILHSGKPGPEDIIDAIEEVFVTVTRYPEVNQLSITIDVADYDDEEWYQGEGQYLAAYAASLLQIVIATANGSSQRMHQSTKETLTTEIRLSLQAYDWEATEGAVEIASEMVREAIDQQAKQYNRQSEVTTKELGATVKIERMRITDTSTVSVDIAIGQLRITYTPRLTGRHVAGTDQRQRILQLLKQHMDRDQREEA